MFLDLPARHQQPDGEQEAVNEETAPGQVHGKRGVAFGWRMARGAT